MSAWPVIGHEWATDLLRRAIESDRHSHAYLISGLPQVGKTTLAKAFAQALACEAGVGSCCGECRACRLIAQDRHPDVQVTSGSGKASIQIDQVRTLHSDAALAPVESRHRIFIVREIERATLPAANALLKVLEEPPSRVVMLLTCTRRDQVLATIRSRCQPIDLRPIPLGQVQAALEQHWGVDPERAQLLARLSGGCLGWAVDASSRSDIWQERTRRLSDLIDLTTADHAKRLEYAEQLSRQAENVPGVLALWTTWWRDLLFVQHDLGESIVNLDRRVQLVQQAELFVPAQVQGVLRDLMQTLRRYQTNVNVRLALDVLILRLPRPSVS